MRTRALKLSSYSTTDDKVKRERTHLLSTLFANGLTSGFTVRLGDRSRYVLVASRRTETWFKGSFDLYLYVRLPFLEARFYLQRGHPLEMPSLKTALLELGR